MDVEEARAPEVYNALQAGMLLEGVHLFRGGAAFVSTTHTEADVERTVNAFERTLRRLRAEALV
jgi:glutamate-1-semialdehyde aminotransferase